MRIRDGRLLKEEVHSKQGHKRNSKLRGRVDLSTLFALSEISYGCVHQKTEGVNSQSQDKASSTRTRAAGISTSSMS